MTKDAFSLEIDMQRQAWLREALRMSAMAILPILLWAVAAMQMLAAFLLFLSQDAPIPFPFNLAVELSFPVRYLCSAAFSMVVLMPIVIVTFVGPYPKCAHLGEPHQA